MKFGTEKNEIAGPTAQKVPTAPFKDDLSTKSANDLMVGSDSDHSGHKPDSIDSALVMNWPAKASEGNVDMGKGTGAAQSVDHSAIQAERVGHLVNQQVVMIRQSGANNLAVSLKLDPHTELSLQLTNHNGQIEASVRWERGAVAGLENHWKDLQESLARQNVQLLPLENRASPRTPVSNSASDTDVCVAFQSIVAKSPTTQPRCAAGFATGHHCQNLSRNKQSNTRNRLPARLGILGLKNYVSLRHHCQQLNRCQLNFESSRLFEIARHANDLAGPA